MSSKKVYEQLPTLFDIATHYCSGCGHGIVHRLVAEVINELNIREKTIGVAPVGCAVVAYDYWNFDCAESAHGRAPAIATAIKRVRPENIVFTYQGDGDLAAIGTAEIIHAANRSENITVLFINNANYGMTGGQMAPTTVLGQKTSTTPSGRKIKEHGYPLKVCELLSNLEGVFSVERTSIHNPQHIIKAKQAIKNAFINQLEGKGFSLVEILSMCPTYWGVTPADGPTWLTQHLIPVFPLGKFK